VDTRANTATVEQEFLPPVHVDIPKAPLSFSKSIEKTTAIVKDEISRFRGQTIQDVIEAQKPMVARMAHQIEAPNDSPPPPSGSLSTIQPPQLLSSVSPVYPDEARRVKMSGVVKLTLTIDVYGRPRNIEIIQHQGMGLDQAAVKAVSQYRFTPAIDMAKGIAIPMKLITDVVFKLY
jgi:TonB family protein